MEFSFWKNRRVFVTGHTGFKGAWLCRVLQCLGAVVTGYSLKSLDDVVYKKIVDEKLIKSYISDIRDFSSLQDAFFLVKPEIVFHLAAQPLVLDAYENPVYTFETNVQGTVNVLECVRLVEGVRSVVIVTTDKVYHNNEWEWGYRENDVLGGNEPYAASKACAELVTTAYKEAFLQKRDIAVSTARAGNVIGGGDVAKNRILPDCIRAARQKEKIIVRNPQGVRPYQHVLEPLFAYLLIAQKQWENNKLADSYNIGPGEMGCVTTAQLVDLFCQLWGDGQAWEHVKNVNAPKESGVLKLDCAKVQEKLNWRPVWDIHKAVENTIAWEKAVDKWDETNRQIKSYVKEFIQ